MKTIKIIDLLSKIANGEEVPTYIKVRDSIFGVSYKFSGKDLDYQLDNDENYLSDYICNGGISLNDEVEIIEDKEYKKIEEIKINYDEFYKHYNITTTINGEKYNSITNSATDKIFCGKINEIIDFINDGRD